MGPCTSFPQNVIHGAELLHGRIVQPSAFLHLGGNEQTLALDLGHLRLHIATASEGQRISRDVAAVKTQDTGHGVPEGGLTVTATTVCDNEGFDLDLANGGETADHLHIVDEFLVTAEKGVQAVEPDRFATVAGRNGSSLSNKVLRRMLSCTCHTKAEVISGIRGTEQIRVSVQILRGDLQHGAGLLQRGGDILGCTALNDIGLICLCSEECFVGFHLFLVHHAFGFGFAVVSMISCAPQVFSVARAANISEDASASWRRVSSWATACAPGSVSCQYRPL